MIRIAICEDNKEQQTHLENLIISQDINDSVDIHKFDSGEDLIDRIDEGQSFAMILLDMKMKALDGIQTAKAIRERNEKSIIIIVTSILEYAVEGYSVDAFEFILKPVDQDKFRKIFRKAIKKIQTDKNKAYVVETRDKLSVVKLNQIVYFESDKKKVTVHCKETIYSSNESISSVETKLSDQGFLRISRYYLVNMQHIEAFNVKEILLSNGEPLIYSKKNVDESKRKYMEYIMEDM
jgi:DNA-binding LytR/AlgR family response regulator